MWTPAVLVALLCAALQPISATGTGPPANGSSAGESPAATRAATPAVATSPSPPGAAGAPDQDSGPVEDHRTTLGAIAATTEPAAAPVDPILPAITSPSEKDDGMPAQQDGSHSLAGQVLDALVSLCERRLRSVTTDAIQQLTSQIDILASNQKKIELALSSYTDRQENMEQHLENLVGEHRSLGKSVDAFKARLLTVETSLDGLQNESNAKKVALKKITADQINITESLNNITVSYTANEAFLHNVLSEQNVLKKSVVNIQTSLDGNVHQHFRNLSTAQQNLSTQLTAVQARIMQMPHFLGHPCQRDSQCAAAVSNSTCGADKRCTCRAEFRPSLESVTRCEYKRLGDSCSSNSHCLMAGAVCRDEVCSCRSGHRNIDNQECRANAGKGEPCRDDGDCAEIGGTCRSGRCTCRESSFNGGEYKYRLTDTDSTSCKEGNIQRKKSGNWDYMCRGRTSEAAARVVCRSMNFSGGQILPSSGVPGADNFYLYSFYCTGSEPHLMSCRRHRTYNYYCPNRKGLRVRCD